MKSHMWLRSLCSLIPKPGHVKMCFCVFHQNSKSSVDSIKEEKNFDFYFVSLFKKDQLSSKSEPVPRMKVMMMMGGGGGGPPCSLRSAGRGHAAQQQLHPGARAQTPARLRPQHGARSPSAFTGTAVPVRVTRERMMKKART